MPRLISKIIALDLKEARTKIMESQSQGNQFSGRRYINLESYSREGKAKRTPVQSIENNGQIYVRTDPKTWKVGRIKRNPFVRIVLSDRNGKPQGSWVDGEAHLVEADETRDQIQRIFKKEYGTIGSLIVDFIARLRGEKLSAVIAIKLRPESSSSTGKGLNRQG